MQLSDLSTTLYTGELARMSSTKLRGIKVAILDNKHIAESKAKPWVNRQNVITEAYLQYADINKLEQKES